MCGRISLYTPPARVARLFHATLAEGAEDRPRPLWNIGPTSPVLGVHTHRQPDAPDRAVEGGEEPRRLLDLFRWGLVPSWAKDLSGGSRLFNARAETVDSKPSFRAAFRRRRLLVPADGFFEWHAGPGGRRRPHYFHRVDGTPMALAGVWEVWRDPRDPDGAPVQSCAIITTRAGPDMEGIHDRMPVVLDPEMLDLWLDPTSEAEELKALLRATRPGTLAHHLVDPRMGNVRHDDPSAIAELVEDRA